MPIGGTYGGVDNPWYASPAAFPLLIGSLLAISGIAIAAKGIAARAHHGLLAFLKRALAAPLSTTSGKSASLVVAYLTAYLALLLLHPFGPPSYIVSTTLFLLAFVLTFYRPAAKFPRPAALALVLVAATAAASLVAYLFSGPLRVPLP